MCVFFFLAAPAEAPGSDHVRGWVGEGGNGVRLGELEEDSNTMPPLRFFTHGC